MASNGPLTAELRPVKVAHPCGSTVSPILAHMPRAIAWPVQSATLGICRRPLGLRDAPVWPSAALPRPSYCLSKWHTCADPLCRPFWRARRARSRGPFGALLGASADARKVYAMPEYGLKRPSHGRATACQSGTPARIRGVAHFGALAARDRAARSARYFGHLQTPTRPTRCQSVASNGPRVQELRLVKVAHPRGSATYIYMKIRAFAAVIDHTAPRSMTPTHRTR